MLNCHAQVSDSIPTANKSNAEIKIKKVDEVPVRFADQMPEFHGGIEDLYEFISENIIYPKDAREKHIQGSVVVEFVIEKDGSIGKTNVLKSVHPLLDEEAVRIIKMLSPWIPAKVNGKPVSIWYTLPVRFSVDDINKQGNKRH
jgi:TonB family protein